MATKPIFGSTLNKTNALAPDIAAFLLNDAVSGHANAVDLVSGIQGVLYQYVGDTTLATTWGTDSTLGANTSYVGYGSTHYAFISTIPARATTNLDIAVGLACLATEPGGYSGIFSVANTTGAMSLKFTTAFGGNGFHLFVSTSSGTSELARSEAVSTATLKDGNYHDIKMEFRGTTAKLYVDGTLYTTFTLTGNVNTAQAQFMVGNASDLTGTDLTVPVVGGSPFVNKIYYAYISDAAMDTPSNLHANPFALFSAPFVPSPTIATASARTTGVTLDIATTGATLVANSNVTGLTIQQRKNSSLSWQAVTINKAVATAAGTLTIGVSRSTPILAGYQVQIASASSSLTATNGKTLADFAFSTSPSVTNNSLVSDTANATRPAQIVVNGLQGGVDNSSNSGNPSGVVTAQRGYNLPYGVQGNLNVTFSGFTTGVTGNITISAAAIAYDDPSMPGAARTFRRLLFGGQQSVTLAPGAVATATASNMNLLPGERVYVLYTYSTTNTAGLPWNGITNLAESASGLDDGDAAVAGATSDLTLTGGLGHTPPTAVSAGLGNLVRLYQPIGIDGSPHTLYSGNTPAVLVYGDSYVQGQIDQGDGTNNYDAFLGMGFGNRLLNAAGIAGGTIGVSGSNESAFTQFLTTSAATYLFGGGSTIRKYTHFLDEYNINQLRGYNAVPTGNNSTPSAYNANLAFTTRKTGQAAAAALGIAFLMTTMGCCGQGDLVGWDGSVSVNGGSNSYADFVAARKTFNSGVRSTPGAVVPNCIGMLDISASIEGGTLDTNTPLAAYQTDVIHPNTAGHRKIAADSAAPLLTIVGSVPNAVPGSIPAITTTPNSPAATVGGLAVQITLGGGIGTYALGSNTGAGTFALAGAILTYTPPATGNAGTATQVVTSGTTTTTISVALSTAMVPPDFTISETNSGIVGVLPIVQGQSANATLSFVRLNGDAGGITVTASGLPAGITMTLSPANPVSGNITTATFAVANTAAPGTYNVVLSGSDGTNTHSATVSIVVSAPNATVSAVTVLPATATLLGNAMLALTVAVAGTNNPSQSVIWAAVGGGTVDASGNFVAPPQGNTVKTITVTATSVADTTKSASCVIMIPALVVAVGSIALPQMTLDVTAGVAGDPPTWTTYVGDTAPSVRFQVLDNGITVDLTGAIALALSRPKNSYIADTQRPLTLVNASAGLVQWDAAPGDFPADGDYWVRFRFVLANGKQLTLPHNGYGIVRVFA